MEEFTFTVVFYIECLVNDNCDQPPIISTKCDAQSQVVGWFWSPDGSTPPTQLNTSSSTKYTETDNNLGIDVSNVSGSDEGLYGCLYNGRNQTNEICIYVYGEFLLNQYM